MKPEFRNGFRKMTELGLSATLAFNIASPKQPELAPPPPIILTTQAEIQNYQPSYPIRGAFVYLWQKTQAFDGINRYWDDFGHHPPNNWFGNSLPDINPAVFNPAEELYSGQDPKALRWIVENLTKAGMDLAISSWWGPGHRTDEALGKLMDVIEGPDSPNPLLRVTPYFEQEGFSDPSASELVDQIQYIVDKYASRTSFLKLEENGKKHPVIFAYGDDHEDPFSLTSRWKEVSDKTGALIVLRINNFGFYRFLPNQPFAWHDYRPALRTVYAQDAISISPGFDSSVPGDDRILKRDPNVFAAASKEAVEEAERAGLKFVLWTTANEDGEGTGFLPRTTVIYPADGQAVPDPNGGKSDTYIKILSKINYPKAIIKPKPNTT